MTHDKRPTTIIYATGERWEDDGRNRRYRVANWRDRLREFWRACRHSAIMARAYGFSPPPPVSVLTTAGSSTLVQWNERASKIVRAAKPGFGYGHYARHDFVRRRRVEDVETFVSEADLKYPTGRFDPDRREILDRRAAGKPSEGYRGYFERRRGAEAEKD